MSARLLALQIFLVSGAALSCVDSYAAEPISRTNIPEGVRHGDAELASLPPDVLEGYQRNLDAKINRAQSGLRAINDNWTAARADLEDWASESQKAQQGALEAVFSLAMGGVDSALKDRAERLRLLGPAYLDRFQASLVRADRRLDEAARAGSIPSEVFKRFDGDLRAAQIHLGRAKQFLGDARSAEEMKTALANMKLAYDVVQAVKEPGPKHQTLAILKIGTEELASELNVSGALSNSGLIYVRLASFGIDYAYSAARFWVSWRETGRLLNLVEGGEQDGVRIASMNERVRILDTVLKDAVAERETVKRALPCSRAKERQGRIERALPALKARLTEIEGEVSRDPGCADCRSSVEQLSTKLKDAEALLTRQHRTVAQTCQSQNL